MIPQSQYSPPKTVTQFYHQLQSAYTTQDSHQLSRLLREFYTHPGYNEKSNESRWKVSVSFDGYRDSGLGALFARMLEAMRAYQIEKFRRGVHFGFRGHLEVLTVVLKMLDQIKDEGDMWLCKPLRQVIRSTKKIFMQASKKDQQTGGAASVKKDNLIIKLQQFKTRRSLNDKVKKQILPLIDNMQVSIMLVYHSYDQINRILDNPKPYGEHGSQFIDNFYFQKAKTAMIYQRFKIAQQFFEKITIKTRNQKRLVLKYLIPCKLFLGKIFLRNPTNQQQYFPQYDPIIEALKKAKFNDYSTAITRYQKVWIKRGIYLLMDKLRIILWRNLLRKVQRALGEDKIEIEKIYRAVGMSGGEERLEECVCVISNLIYQGYVKGYIFQNEEQRVLVLKRGGEAFPSLSK